MEIGGLFDIIGVLVSLLALVTALLLEYPILAKRTTNRSEKSYSERLTTLLSDLSKATTEVDSIVAELETVTKERANKAEQLKTDLSQLQTQEQELKNRIEQLQNVPIEVAEYFAELSTSPEKNQRRREWLFFFGGAFVGFVSDLIASLIVG